MSDPSSQIFGLICCYFIKNTGQESELTIVPLTVSTRAGINQPKMKQGETEPCWGPSGSCSLNLIFKHCQFQITIISNNKGTKISLKQYLQKGYISTLVVIHSKWTPHSFELLHTHSLWKKFCRVKIGAIQFYFIFFFPRERTLTSKAHESLSSVSGVLCDWDQTYLMSPRYTKPLYMLSAFLCIKKPHQEGEVSPWDSATCF